MKLNLKAKTPKTSATVYLSTLQFL